MQTEEKKISDEKLQKALGFTPHEKQKEIIDCKARIRVVCAGKRAGKTLVASYEVVKEALLENKRIWIVAPDYNLSQIIFDQVVIFLTKILNSRDFSIVKKPIPQIHIKLNGTIIECKSGESPKGMMGRAVDLIVMDEASRVAEDVWKRFLRPNIVDRKGRVIMISTPNGLNWFYDMWLYAKTRSGAFHFTSKDNPHFGLDEWEEIKETTPQIVFEQEYEAKFVSDAGSVFRGIDDIAVLEPQAPEEGQVYVIGVDLAKHEDYTVMCVVNRFKKEMVWMDRFTDIDYNLQKKRIIALSKKYNNAKVIIDGSGSGDPVAEDLKRDLFVENYRMHAMKHKQQLIEKLSLFIEQQNIKILNNEILINELKRYAFTQSSQGYKYSAPKNQHDDAVIALALAVWGLNPGNYQPDDKPKRHKFFNDYL